VKSRLDDETIELAKLSDVVDITNNVDDESLIKFIVLNLTI